MFYACSILYMIAFHSFVRQRVFAQSCITTPIVYITSTNTAKEPALYTSMVAWHEV